MEESANFIPLGSARDFGRERRGSTSNTPAPTSISKKKLSVSIGASILAGPKVIGATPGRLSFFCVSKSERNKC